MRGARNIRPEGSKPCKAFRVSGPLDLIHNPYTAPNPQSLSSQSLKPAESAPGLPRPLPSLGGNPVAGAAGIWQSAYGGFQKSRGSLARGPTIEYVI